jgi:hypothetical protein
MMIVVTRKHAYGFAMALAFAASFMLVVFGLGIGIIGADGDRANMMYGAVLLVGIIGALLARFRPHGMARTLVAMAAAHAAVGLIALIARLGQPASPPLEIIGLTGFFVLLFVGSAWLFQQAAHGRAGGIAA